MSTILKILNGLLWLIQRFFKRKDANEPQARIDTAKTAAATDNDALLNQSVDDARMRLNQSSRDTK